MTNYKDTVFLPQTEFSMRAGLAKKEPEILKSWQKIDLYSEIKEKILLLLYFMMVPHMQMEIYTLGML